MMCLIPKQVFLLWLFADFAQVKLEGTPALRYLFCLGKNIWYLSDLHEWLIHVHSPVAILEVSFC